MQGMGAGGVGGGGGGVRRIEHTTTAPMGGDTKSP